MYFALDKNNLKVDIQDAIQGNEYFCQICHEQLIIKRGSIKAHHFAHQSNSECDGWSHDMSEWHHNWQLCFPEINREVVLISGGKMHIADILINNTVVEFQHSPMSPDEFDDRNRFYTSLGYKIIWLFDLTEEMSRGSIKELDNNFNKYKWKYPKRTFLNYDYNDKNILLFFDFGIVDEGYPTESRDLAKVVWSSSRGFEYFAVENSKRLTEDDFVRFVSGAVKPFELSDLIYDMYNDHSAFDNEFGRMFYGCYKSKTGYALFDDNKYYSLCGHELCSRCKHTIGYYKCKYLIDELAIPNDARILKIERDKNGFIINISYTYKCELIKKEAPKFAPTRSTISILWNNLSNPSEARFFNTKSKKYVRIKKSPDEQIQKYGKIYGQISEDQYKFNDKSYVIYNFDKPIWECASWRRK